MKRESNSNLSGNELYYTNCSILLVKNMLCRELHCQKGFNLILFSYSTVMSARDTENTARGVGPRARPRQAHQQPLPPHANIVGVCNVRQAASYFQTCKNMLRAASDFRIRGPTNSSKLDRFTSGFEWFSSICFCNFNREHYQLQG